MQLSKRDFQKLSVKEQKHLMNLSSQPTKQKNGSQKRPLQKRQSGIPRPQRVSTQASVAAAYASPALGRAPQIKATRDTCNIQHRELISNIQGSVGFTVGQNLAVNPGIAATFPWLSIMAQGWEEYRFRSLRFCFKTRTGSNTPGSVIMAPDYDAADAAPVTEQIMSSYAQVIEDAPWKDINCVLKTASMSSGNNKRHFIRSGPLGPNLDIKTYDIASFFVATVDGTAVPWGKLWVEYDIDFYIPQLPSQGAVQLNGGQLVSGGVLTAANPLGTLPVLTAGGVGISANALSVISFQTPGTYLVSYTHTGTVITNSVLTNVANSTVTVESGPVISSGTSLGVIYSVITSQPNASVQMTATATTITGTLAYIAQVPAGSI